MYVCVCVCAVALDVIGVHRRHTVGLNVCVCVYTVRALQHDLASIHLHIPPPPPQTQFLYGPTVSRDAFNLTPPSYLAHILA